MDVGDWTPAGGHGGFDDPHEPFVVTARALIVYTSPADYLVMPRTSRYIQEPVLRILAPTASGTGVVRDIQAPLSGPVGASQTTGELPWALRFVHRGADRRSPAPAVGCRSLQPLTRYSKRFSPSGRSDCTAIAHPLPNLSKSALRAA